MVELVADHGILFAEKRLEQTAVGVKAARIKNRVLHSQEDAQCALEFLVDRLSAADESHRRHAEPVLVDAVLRCLHEAGIVRQAKIVIRAEVQYRGSALEIDARALRARDHPLGLVEAVCANALELACEMRLKTVIHRLLSRWKENRSNTDDISLTQGSASAVLPGRCRPRALRVDFGTVRYARVCATGSSTSTAIGMVSALSPRGLSELGKRIAPALAGLGVGLGAGFVFEAIATPLPWMIGPLLAIASVRVAGLPVTAIRGGRQAGQWIIGTALGLYFTPTVAERVIGYRMAHHSRGDLRDRAGLCVRLLARHRRQDRSHHGGLCERSRRRGGDGGSRRTFRCARG